MGTIIAITFGLALWIVLTALDYKPMDAFLPFVLILTVAVAGRMLSKYIPGKQSPDA